MLKGIRLAALLAAGHPDTIEKFPDGTRTSADAAAAVGCAVAQIAKSKGVPVTALETGDEQVKVLAQASPKLAAISPRYPKNHGGRSGKNCIPITRARWKESSLPSEGSNTPTTPST